MKIRARLSSSPEARPDSWIAAQGTSLAQAVANAAHKLGLTPGRSLGGERLDSHEWHWRWAQRDAVTELRVRESRSGERGEGTTRQVQLRLRDEDADRLDDLAARWGVTRSGAVVRLVRDAETSACWAELESDLCGAGRQLARGSETKSPASAGGRTGREG